MIPNGALSPQCIVAMIALAVAFVAIAALFFSRMQIHRMLARQNVLLGELPLLFCVCDRSGRILQLHTGSQTPESAGGVRKIQDLSLPGVDIALIADRIRRCFKEDPETVFDLPGGRWQCFLRRLPESVFGREAVLWGALDVRRQYELQQDIRDQVGVFQVIVESIAGGVMVVDAGRCIVLVNSYAGALGGFQPRQAQRQDYRRFFRLNPAEFRDEVESVFVSGKGIVWRDRIALLDASGRETPIRASVAPITDAEGRVKQIVIAFLDDSQSQAERREAQIHARALALTSDFTHSNYFRYAPGARTISCGHNFDALWPLFNGVPLSEGEWVHRDDLDEFMARRNRLLDGLDPVWEMDYRSNYFGEMRYYRLRAVLERDAPDSVAEATIFGVIQDVTDTMEANHMQQESMFQMKMLLELFPCPFFIKEVSDDYRYRICSNAWHELSGHTAAEILEHTDFDLFPTATAEEFRRVDREANARGRAVHVFASQGNASEAERRYYRVIVEAYTTPDGRRMVFGAGLDFTDVEKANLRQNELRQFYEEIINHLPACVLVKEADHDFRYVVWNKMLEEHTGFPAAEVLGKNDFEISPYPGQAQAFRDGDRQLLATGETVKRQELIYSATGRKFYYNSTKTLIRSGARSYVAELCLDMSRERELEERTQEVVRELNRHVMYADTLNTCLKRIAVENNFEKAVNDMLLIIGGAAGADRCYVFLFAEEGSRADCAFEWVRGGVSGSVGPLRRMEQDGFSEWRKALEAKQYLLIEDAGQLPNELQPCAGLLQARGVRTAVAAGIPVRGRLVGFLGMDFVREKRPIGPESLRTLQDAVSIYLLAYQRKVQFDTIAESAANQKLIIDMVNLPLLLINRDFTVTHANNSALALTGIDKDKVIGRPCCMAFCHEDAPGSQCLARQTFESGRSITAERRLNSRDYQITTMPIVHDGQVVQVLESFVDLTEINRGKELLRQTARDAEEAARAKSLFLATISHELRTPLNAVIGFAELLEMGGLKPNDQRDAVRSIHLAGTTLLSLINDVLDLSKLEAGQMTLVPTRVDLEQILDELHRIFDHKLKENNLRGNTRLPSDLPWLYLDSLRLRQILLNLFGNAVKFTHQGHIDIEVEFVPRDREFGALTIRVRDTGIGVASEYVDRIFQPFVQEENRDKAQHQGTGLGLPICRRLVEQMQGTLTVESVLGKGSCFSVHLPDVRFDPAPRTRSEERRREAESDDMPDLRVLLVDDVAMNLKVLEAMARKLKLTIRSCASGPEALAALAEFKPDVILTDMWMPEMNGVELAKVVKTTPGAEHIRVVAVTADAEISGADAVELFDGVLLKPVTLEKLKLTLRKLPDRSSAPVAEHGGSHG